MKWLTRIFFFTGTQNPTPHTSSLPLYCCLSPKILLTSYIWEEMRAILGQRKWEMISHFLPDWQVSEQKVKQNPSKVWHTAIKRFLEVCRKLETSGHNVNAACVSIRKISLPHFFPGNLSKHKKKGHQQYTVQHMPSSNP